MSDGYYIMEFVDDIAKIIDTASKVPMTGKVMLDKRELLDIIYSVQDHLPEEIRNAQLIINQKDRILQNAVAQKEQMLYEAKRDSDNLRRDTMEMMKNRVQNHDYVKEAKEVAEKLIAEANENATAIRQDAENYVDKLLNDLEEEIKIKNKELLNYMKVNMEQFALNLSTNLNAEYSAKNATLINVNTINNNINFENILNVFLIPNLY